MACKKVKQIGFISILLAFFFICAPNIFAQGAAAPQGRNSDNKADENIKSLARINPSTLAMEMSVPFLSYPGRNGNSLPVGISYSSKLWRMRNQGTYFYLTPIGHYKQYVTQLIPTYAERSAAGWTSSIAFPVIEEKLELYNQEGNPFSGDLDIDRFNSLFQTAINTSPGSELINNPNLPCGWACTERTRWCGYDGGCSEWQCSGWDYNGANCGGGGGWDGGSACYYQNGFCPTSCSFCVEPPHCPDWNPQCDINPDIPPTIEPAQKMHYVKRVYVRMVDGATHEFRKSDAIFGHCAGGVSDGPDCESIDPNNWGMFLSVDGSGMKLERTADGSTLYLPDGNRFLFPNDATGVFDQSALYQATDFIDVDGNRSKFEPTREENQFADNNQHLQKMTDTLGREIYDPLPQNLIKQSQQEGDQSISLPGLNGSAAQNYQMKWRHLKPVPCEGDVTTNCGINEGALENQSENVYFYSAHICFGSAENSVDPNNQFPNQKLFPSDGLGLRSCNPDSGGTPATAVGKRFNPVVLSEIVLPNNQSYIFKYNQFGEITKITYPTGSYETFKYEKITPLNGFNEAAYDQTNRGVTERKVYDSAHTLVQRWQYIAATGKITTIAPKGDNPSGSGIKTERYLHTDNKELNQYGFNNPLAGMLKEEKTYDENGQLRQRTLVDYIVEGPVPTNDSLRPAYSEAKRDPRQSRSVTFTFEPPTGGGSNLVNPDPGDGPGGGDDGPGGGTTVSGSTLVTFSKTEYDENGNPDPEHFSHLNVKGKKAYNYASVPASTAISVTNWTTIESWFSDKLAGYSEQSYLYNDYYMARGINSIPTESREFDKNDNLLGKTQVVLDESTYLVPDSDLLTGDLTTTWVNPVTDLSIPSNSRNLRGKPTTSKVWDSDNNAWIQTHTQYDQYGNVRKVWAPNEDNNSSRFVETQYSSDYACAYPTKVITPAPDPTNTGHGTTEGSFATTTYDFITGLTLTATNEFGQTTQTEYNDSLLRPTKVSGVGGFVIPISEMIYDDNALTVKVRKQIDETNWDEAVSYMDSFGRTFKTKAKDSQGDVFVETKYDLLGRVQMATNPYRATEPNKYWSLTEYDELGRARQTREPVVNQTPGSPSGSILGTTEYSISTVSNFVGTVVTTTDASGRKGRSITNAFGQLLRVDEPTLTGGTADDDLGSLSNPAQPTFYTYSPQGKMVKVQQGKTGEATIQYRYFLYDSLGRLIRVRQPEQEVNANLNLTDAITGNNQWTAAFSYDLLGNIKRTTDANGVNAVSEYDKANRVTKHCYTKPDISPVGLPAECSQISASQISADTPAVEYFYDGKGLDQQLSPNYAKGKLTKVTSSISETRYTIFDSFGRLKQGEQRTPSADETVASAPPRISKYTYNLSGELLEETYPSGRVVRNVFESDGDLAKIESKYRASAQFLNYASNFAYTSWGGTDKLQLGNGRWETAKFNSRLQTTEIALGTSSTDTSLWKLNYDYGELQSNGTVDTAKNTGNIARQTINFNGLASPFVQTFKYDSLYRLKEARETTNGGATQTWKQTFDYDRFGNRTNFSQIVGQTQLAINSQTLPAIDAAKNRFSANQGYEYDKNGNITKDIDSSSQARNFIFNGENKQTEVKNASGVVIGRYFYDGEGKRVKKKVYDSTGVNLIEETVFVYDGIGKLVAEYSTQPPPEIKTTSYTATDLLDSPRVITDSQGNVTSRRDFMPFGEEISIDAQSRTTANKYPLNNQDGVRQRFTGYQKDKETNLDFAEARYYNNQHARFTAVDPLLASGKSANPQSFNRYAYVDNNPLNFTDPSGTCKSGQCPPSYRGTVYTATESDGTVRYNNEIPTDDGLSWSVVPVGTDVSITDKTDKFGYRVFNYGEGSNGGSGWERYSTEPQTTYDGLPRRWQDFNYLGERWEFPQGTWGGRNTITIDGETDIERYLDRQDEPKSAAMAMGMVAALGPLGGSGSPPTIGSSRSFSNASPTFPGNKNAFIGPMQLEYAPRVRERAVQDPKSHNFPFSFDNLILSTKPTVTSNGYRYFRLPGTMNSRSNLKLYDYTGYYEIGVTQDSIINHRYFQPTGKIPK